MNSLHELPNISKVIEEKLIDVGVYTPIVLEDIGSKEAFRRIKQRDSTACTNFLYALEGAIEGKRWHYLPDDKKQELKIFYKTL